MKRRNRPKSRFTRDAHARTIVTLELMRTTVLRVARGTFRYVAPAGHSVAPTRSIT